MGEDHTRVAWPPYSYENIYFIQERYESVVMSSHMVDPTRAIPTLMHKVLFPYESPRLPSRSRRAGRTDAPGRCSPAGAAGDHREAPWDSRRVVCSYPRSSATSQTVP